MKILDTLSGKKKLFVPRKKNCVDIFVCGPTVYDHAHIGHARTYIAMDAFVKYLRMKKFDVTYVQNITDIDDKIIARAKQRNENPQMLARRFEKEYRKDMKALAVNSVSRYARATDFIPQIIEQIKMLIKKGYAYETQTGVYFEVKKFRDYGKLSRQALSKLRKAARIEQDETKKNPEDFALWKKPEPGLPAEALAKAGEPAWQSPWGLGRPGWHIEDTAITETLFGPQYDIHGGARDLIFPHHESEIAQMEASSGKKPMVRYWMHTGFLTVDKEKMSKSLGNFVTIRKFLNGGDPSRPYLLRLLVLSKHYRSPIIYKEEELSSYNVQLMGLDRFVAKLRANKQSRKEMNILDAEYKKEINECQQAFWESLEDDFNTAEALGTLFKIISLGNSWTAQAGSITKDASSGMLSFFKKADKAFGIINWDYIERLEKKLEARPSQKAKSLKEKREQLRKEKKWQEADALREKILKLGYEVEDTPEGPRIYKKEK